MYNFKISIEKLKSISPIKLIVLSFLFLIALGTIFLLLPISTRGPQSADFMTASFTAISSSCVSGLVLLDTWSYWSWFGQFIILMLIQIGAIGIITFMTGITLLTRKKLGLTDMNLTQFYTSSNIMDTPRLIKTIILFTFYSELIGSLILMIRFIPRLGIYGIWVSIFLSISGYCNAGFDIMGFESPGISLQNYVDDPLVSITMSLLILIGGLGFIVISDIHLYIKEKYINLKNKTKKHTHLNLHSYVVITSTIVITIISTAVIFILEYNNTLAEFNVLEKLNACFFLTCTSRSAGFTNIDPSLQTNATKLFTCLIMFIGSSPCSTGGGIKTTTFVVIMFTVISILKGKKDAIIKKHLIDKSLVYRSLTIAILAIIVIYVTSIILLIAEGSNSLSYIDIVFETVSAFSTGISVGITAQLHSVVSKFFLSLLMFLGRIGPFSLAIGLILRKNKKHQTVLPITNIMVG